MKIPNYYYHAIDVKRVKCLMKKWDLVKHQILYDASPWLKLFCDTVRIENNQIINDFYTIEQQDSVVIFAVTNDDLILGIRSYKHGPKRININLPSGYIMDNESPLSAAKRELLEETGYCSNYWVFLGSYVVEGNRGCGNIHFFITQNLEKRQEPASNDLEISAIEKIPLSHVTELLINGDIATTGAALGICLGLLKLQLITKKDNQL